MIDNEPTYRQIQQKAEREFWERVFCAALSGSVAKYPEVVAITADLALKSWRKRWGHEPEPAAETEETGKPDPYSTEAVLGWRTMGG